MLVYTELSSYTLYVVPHYTAIDECATTPCLNNGICIDGINRFVCRCSAGYTGTTCEIGM